MYYQFKKTQMIVFSSGELAQLLGVTKQSIMNYRKKGMPYCSMTRWGYYEYNFEAIQWVFDNGYKLNAFPKTSLRAREEIKKLRAENRSLKLFIHSKNLLNVP